jgi:NAD(P)-dependent dehydrogenase (short-subunit alcohol dehydrogenase family)
MANKKVWLITGAGRGLGVDIARSALAAGYAVAATGRNTTAVENAIGKAAGLLTVRLDVTSSAPLPDVTNSRPEWSDARG